MYFDRFAKSAADIAAAVVILCNVSNCSNCVMLGNSFRYESCCYVTLPKAQVFSQIQIKLQLIFCIKIQRFFPKNIALSILSFIVIQSLAIHSGTNIVAMSPYQRHSFYVKLKSSFLPYKINTTIYFQKPCPAQSILSSNNPIYLWQFIRV